jgi:hypothetical protein
VAIVYHPHCGLEEAAVEFEAATKLRALGRRAGDETNDRRVGLEEIRRLGRHAREEAERALRRGKSGEARPEGSSSV